MQKGDYIRLTQDVTPWYSGYGDNPVHTLRAGETGIVTHVGRDLVSVNGRKRGDVLARFASGCGSWQAELVSDQYETVEHSDKCYRTVCHITCPIGD